MIHAKFIGTAMLSLFEENFAPVTIHILHDNTLTADAAEFDSFPLLKAM